MGRNSTELKKSHTCGAVKCLLCLETKDEDHACKLKVAKTGKEQNFLAFVKGQVCNVPYFECLLCRAGALCSMHKNKTRTYIAMNFLALCYETQMRGQFNLAYYSNAELNLDGEEPKILECKYWPDVLDPFAPPISASTFNKKKTFRDEMKLRQEGDAAALRTCTAKFLYDIFCVKELSHYNFILVDTEFGLDLICAELNHFGINYSPVEKESQIFAIFMTNRKIAFKAFRSFLDVPLHQLCEMRPEFKRHLSYFPPKLNMREFYDISLPPREAFRFSLYCGAFDNLEVTKSKIRHIEEMLTKRKKNERWIFRKEICHSTKEALLLATKAALSFCNDCFETEQSLLTKCGLQASEKVGSCKLNSVFNYCGISGYSFDQLKLYTVDCSLLYAAPKQASLHSVRSSRREYEFVSFLRQMLQEDGGPAYYDAVTSEASSCIVSFKGEIASQFGIKYCKPDLLASDFSVAANFLGCYFHGHLNCAEATRSPQTVLRSGLTAAEEEARLDKQKAALLMQYPEMTLLFVWECQWEAQKKKSQAIRDFVKALPPRPCRVLSVRDANRAIPSCLLALSWTKELYPDEVFMALDVNSAYPTICLEGLFPQGRFVTLYESDLKEGLSVINDKISFNGRALYGIALCTVTSTPNDALSSHFPFLPLRNPDGSTVNLLCTKCQRESGRSIKKRKLQSCRHPDVGFSGDYVIETLNFALLLGYEIKIHQVTCTFSGAPIFKKFAQFFCKRKAQFSGFPKDCTTRAQQVEHVECINRALLFEDEAEHLKVEEVVNDPMKREQAKMQLNSSLGKWSLRIQNSKVQMVRNERQLRKLLKDTSKKVTDVLHVDEDKMLLQTELSPSTLGNLMRQRETNAIIGAHVTALSHIMMYEHFLKLASKGAIVHLSLCDALFFSWPKNSPCPLPISGATGDFKHLHSEEIISFQALTPSSYCLEFKSDTGKKRFKIRARGFSLDTHIAGSILTPETMEKFVKEDTDSPVIFLPCLRKVPERGGALAASSVDKSAAVVVRLYRFKRELQLKRLVIKTPKTRRLIQMSFGWKCISDLYM